MRGLAMGILLLAARSATASVSLEEAVHLLQGRPETLGDRLPVVAETVFRLDPSNDSGAVFDAAMILALEDHPRRDEALAWLEAHAAEDPRERFAYVLFERTARTLQRMLEIQGAGPERLRPLGRRLLSEVAAALPHMPDDGLRAQLYVLAAVAHRLCGALERARSLMSRARAMTGTDREEGVDDVP